MDRDVKLKYQRRKGVKGFLWSFVNAARGLGLMLKSQRNFYVHLLALVVTLSTAFYYPLTFTERAIIVIMIALVLSAEIFNSSLEKLCDLVDENYNSEIGKIKDMSAAAVLVLAIASVVVAAFIFLPYL
jgi:diacylglycerol kinase (ATP)